MTNYGPKKLYYVPAKVGLTDPSDPATGYSVNYVFESNQLSSVLNDLGCLPITSPDQLKTLDSGAVASFFAAKKNRPRRATQRSATGYNSGFHAIDKQLTGSTWLSGGFGAKPASTAPPLYLQSDPTNFSVSVFVRLGPMKYAWNMSKARLQYLQADFGSLGIEFCIEADRNQYIWGADAPKPAIFVTQLSGMSPGIVNTVSAFVGRSRNDQGKPIQIGGSKAYNLKKGEITLFSLLSNHKSFK